MIERYALWLTAHPIRVLLLSVVAVMMLASCVTRLAMDQDYRVFFSKEFPPLEALDNLHDTYNKNDNVLGVYSRPSICAKSWRQRPRPGKSPIPRASNPSPITSIPMLRMTICGATILSAHPKSLVPHS